MFNSHVVLKMILKQNPVIPYLESKGHYPVKTYPTGRSLYRCPMPDHSEKKPSFVVYTTGEYENFYCFGCGAKHNIIHLMCRLEGIRYREALNQLGHGLSLLQVDRLLEAMVELDKLFTPNEAQEIGYDLITLTRACRRYLERVDYMTSEVAVVEKVYDTIDDDITDFAFESLQETIKRVPKLLKRRGEQLMEKGLIPRGENGSDR